MKLNLTNYFMDTLTSNGITFCYSGNITQKIMEDLGKVLKLRMEIDGTEIRKIHNVFSVFIEQIQNIIRHSAVSDDQKKGIIIIGEEEEKFYIIAGNLIENTQKDELINFIEQVKFKSKEELKSLKRERLKSLQFLPGGAGLGFIEMTFRASEPVEYEVKSFDNLNSFFSFKVTV